MLSAREIFIKSKDREGEKCEKEQKAASSEYESMKKEESDVRVVLQVCTPDPEPSSAPSMVMVVVLVFSTFHY